MKKESMLVVEDEKIMREALVDYFSDVGHEVDAADDGKKSLEKVNLKDYNVIIIDLKLPGRDGLSVLQEVREINPKAKVIIITAFPSIDTEEEAKRRGATDYLPKPFELSYLETLINRSYELEVVPTPPVEEPIVEEPVVEEEIVTPCIWMQAGIVQKRMCTIGYQCLKSCKFHAAMIKKEKFRNDQRIQPYLDRLNSLIGRKQCRYTMSGEISLRSCDRLFMCEKCDFDQTIQDEIDRQLAVKTASVKKVQAKKYSRTPLMDESSRSDN